MQNNPGNAFRVRVMKDFSIGGIKELLALQHIQQVRAYIGPAAVMWHFQCADLQSIVARFVQDPLNRFSQYRGPCITCKKNAFDVVLCENGNGASICFGAVTTKSGISELLNVIGLFTKD